MDHKIASEMANYLESIGVLTTDELKKRLQISVEEHAHFYIQCTYSLPVPNCTLAKAIKAGKYDWVNSDINDKNFSTDETCFSDNKSMALFHFNKYISSEDAIKEMDVAGYRPATLADILAFGEKHPNLQKEYPIVALGSSVVFDSKRLVPVLWFVVVGGRRLNLHCFVGGWRSSYRFLAVRK